MIYCLFHNGSGLGDMIHRYITVRTLAEEKGYAFGALGEFKGDFFLNQPNIVSHIPIDCAQWNEKDVRDAQNNDIRSYDPEVNFIEDNTIIDGSFEDERYYIHNLKNIDTWLQVEPLELPDDLCIISHRGGEYKLYPALYLSDGYWHCVVEKMRKINPNMRFQVQTDDPEEARRIFPSLETIDNKKISHSKHSAMGYNWRAIRYAHYLILGNSAFSTIPSLLSPAKVILAPRYHAGHNVGKWMRPACYHKRYEYISSTDYL